MNNKLLLEVGTEEIPAGFMPPALAQLAADAEKMLTQARLAHSSIKALGTPRRMVLLVEDVADKQADAQEERLGPFVAQAYDASGQPTKAALGFARSCGAALSDLGRAPTPKGDKLLFVRQVPGRDTVLVLSELLPGLISGLNFPKSMRWGTGEFRFVRPVHWLLSLLGPKPIPLSLAGIHSDTKTYGHRFTHPEEVAIKSPDEYLARLKGLDVMLDQAERQTVIEKGIEELGRKLGGEVLPDPGLLSEVVHLVEIPVVVAGRIEESFLKIPAAVLIEAMRAHQRYFAVKKPGPGMELLPHFITVCNNPAARPEEMARGNERVLTARLRDAEFFYQEDCRKPLEVFAQELTGMLFQERLGSYADKAVRLKVLAKKIASLLKPGDRQAQADAERAAYLCKADLGTQMVGEFPALQGVMGGDYARVSGENKEVAEAVADHYLPTSAEDIEKRVFPGSAVGDAVSLADKLDSLVGCWGVGLAPTGSADPYALRRLSLGILNIIIHKGYSLSIPALLDQALAGVKDRLRMKPEQVREEVLEFIKTRLRNQLIDAGFRYDAVDAGLSVWNGDVVDTMAKIKALSGFKEREDFEPLMIAFKRVVNIIEGQPGPVNTDAFEHVSEAVLYSEFTRVRQGAAPLIESKDYDQALTEMASLRPAVDRFFDDVMVNVEDQNIRENRHALLNAISGLFKQVGDFGKIVLERGK